MVASVLLTATEAVADVLLSSRVWPAQEYTRVTLESAQAIKHQYFFVKDPERLVLDLEGVDVNEALKGLPAKVGVGDPYIKSVRVARNRPNVIRIVFDLKTEVKPSVFAVPPAGEYKHRLVLDIYPLNPPDPLLALLVSRPDAIVGEAATKPVTELPAPPPVAAATVPESPPLPVLKPEPGKPEARPLERPIVVDKPLERPIEKPIVVEKPSLAAKGDKSTEKSSRGAPVKERLVIVAIDAGHGGEDPGAKGKLGTREKDVTLAIARRLKALMDKESNLRAILVRDGDYFIPLAQRVVKSRSVQADLFVSIHADSWVRPDARGSSVYALSERGATSTAARMLAQRENESDLIGGVNIGVKDPVLARTLLDLSLTATINDSLKLGRAVLTELSDVNALHKGAVEQASFAVLKAPDTPSILVETAFISNPDEERRLKDSAYQDKIATAILGGVKRYLAQNPPLARSKVASF